MPLPIDPLLPEIQSTLSHSSCLVLQAPTGAGKTTRVPLAILDADLLEAPLILVLEPRRIAARAAARRMAQDRGGAVGEEVGYQVRFERRAGKNTRVLVVTEGILLRKLQEDPFLEDVGAVVFDEFHERSLQSDLALAMVRRTQLDVRPDLKIVVMSATLDAGPVSAFLDHCPMLTSEGRSYPVEVEHNPILDVRKIHEGAARGAKKMAARTSGHVLVFLPGVGEIRRTEALLSSWAREEGVKVMPLYGNLSPREQDAVLAPSETQKIILATNVAETSLTIPGTRAVVDTGLARVMRYDPGKGMDRLELMPISRASAEQRRGRAGREAPGLCMRLWSEHQHLTRRAFEIPEIQRVDLASSVLHLMAWGEPDVDAFPWFEAPNPESIERALALLELLGAVSRGRLTSLGETMAHWPLAPRLSRLLIEGDRLGKRRDACLVAALLSERDPFESRRGASKSASGSDVMDRIQALRRFERGQRVPSLQSDAARFVLRARDQLLKIASRALPAESRSSLESEEVLGKILIAAFPDRIARRRFEGSRKAAMSGGGGAELVEQSSVLHEEFFVCVDIGAGQRGERSDARVFMASGLQKRWLPASLIAEVREVAFDAEREKVVSFHRKKLGHLVLSEKIGPVPDLVRASEVLAERASQDLQRVLPKDQRELLSFLMRVRSLRHWVPELELPDLSEEGICARLPELCMGLRSFAELRRMDWVEALRGTLSWPQWEALEREAPEKIEVPSGSKIRLQYREDAPPILPVRIQEVFGLGDTPRVARGRVPVLMHLLAPNMRPQQVTQDLRSFWASTYAEVRKELRQRYPKHSWPEDPAHAEPQKRPSRKRR